jgi:hypothetical protein
MDTVQVKIVKIIGYANGVVKLLGVNVNEGGVSIQFSCVPLATLSIGDVLTVPNPMEQGAVLRNTLIGNPVAIYTLELAQLDLMSRSTEGFDWATATLAKERGEAEKGIVSLVMDECPYNTFILGSFSDPGMCVSEPGISLANPHKLSAVAPVSEVRHPYSLGVLRGEAMVFGKGNAGSGSILNDNAKAAVIPEPPEVVHGLKAYMEAFGIVTARLIKIITDDVDRNVTAADLLTYINWGTQLIQQRYKVVLTSNTIPFGLNLIGLDTLRLRIHVFLADPNDSNLVSIADEIQKFIERLPHAEVTTLSKQI